MSARDRKFVNENIWQLDKLQAYYGAKGKPIPPNVLRLRERYEQWFPDWRLPTALARFWREQIVSGLDKPNVRDIYTRLVALVNLIELLESRGLESTRSWNETNVLSVKLMNYSRDLEHQYKVSATITFSEMTRLDEWEREQPN